MITTTDLRQARDWGILAHQSWKAQILVNDNIAADRWNVVWGDDTVDDEGPMVENIYKGAFEDKVSTAAVGPPSIFVPARYGTRSDRAERESQKRRRVYESYWDRSNMERLRMKLYGDWFHMGSWYLIPWTDWIDRDGNVVPPASRVPRMMRLDPRQAYPLAHDGQGDLTEVMFIRRRRFAELEKEYGHDHPTLASFRNRREHLTQDRATILEEIWYFDTHQWAVAFGDSQMTGTEQGRQFYSREAWANYVGGQIIEWATEPTPHRLPACPVVEAKRYTHDGEYRGAIEDTIPQLRIAQNFQARIFDDLEGNIYAPVVMDNIENPEDYGPGAQLLGTGEGQAKVEYARSPVNFEAQRSVESLVEGARQQAAWPQQRAGDPGASIVSQKGVVSLAGNFNAELAWAQMDTADGLQRANRVTAAFDEHHCPGEKQIEGIEGKQSWHESYDPTVIFAGDYRNKVTYGDRFGLDAQQYITQLAMAGNLGWKSRRNAAAASGLVDDPLAEETDIAIEQLTDLFMQGVLPQRIQQGDEAALKAFVDKIDSDKMTARAAVLETIREMTPLPGAMPGGGPGGGGDPLQMMASLQAGGIPGNAEGLPEPPRIGNALRNALPAQTQRLAREA
jgi:hypothetical protein